MPRVRTGKSLAPADDQPSGSSLFTIGATAHKALADDLFAGGMNRADAVEEAYDFFLRRAGGHLYRVGEVWVGALPDGRDGAHALCVKGVA